MSDVTMFPIHSVLERHTLDVVTFRWDGTHDQAAVICRELVREMEFRDGEVTVAHYRNRINSRDGGPGPALELGFARHSDSHEWRLTLKPTDWVVLHLFEQRLHHVSMMDSDDGDRLFHPIRPIVVLHPETKAIT